MIAARPRGVFAVSETTGDNPLEPLIELFVYAPVGLLYEHQEVLPQLVKRGRSQVQLARVIGEMAARQGRGGPTGADAGLSGLATLLAKVAGDVLNACNPPAGPSTAAPADDHAPAGPGADPAGSEPAGDDSITVAAAQLTERSVDNTANSTPAVSGLPIAHYDELTARDIIALLGDLTAEERERVRAHEQANRARKTVLGKIDRLAG